MSFETELPATIEKPIESGIPKEILDMYVVPGYEESYTEHSLQRYRRQSEQLEQDMAEAKEILQSGDFSNVKAEMIPMLLSMAGKEQLPELIRRGFETSDYDILHISASYINCAAIEFRSALLVALSEKIEKGLETSNPTDLIALTRSLQFISKCENLKKLQTRLFEKIRYGLEIDQESKDLMSSFLFAKGIRFVEAEDRYKLRIILERRICQGLESNDLPTMLAGAESIKYAKEKNRAKLIRKGFATENPVVIFSCAESIKYAKEQDRASLIRDGYILDNSDIAFLCMESIKYVPYVDRTWLLPLFIEKVQHGLESHDNDQIRKYFSLITLFPVSQQRQIYDAVRDRVGPIYVEGPLYRKARKGFFMHGFEKTGSGTTLLGKKAGIDMVGKIIIRHLELDAFLEWKKLYDDADFWKKNGFDYIPIEPIVSFAFRKSGDIDIFSGVLDLSLLEWEARSVDWVKELRSDAKRLMNILSLKSYNHGHIQKKRGYTHDGNFCLRFFRNEDGSIDYSKKPRIYLIDFDQAVSEKKTA